MQWYLTTGGSPDDQESIVQRGLTKRQTRKGKYDGKRIRENAIEVRETAKEELQMRKSVENNRWEKNYPLDPSLKIIGTFSLQRVIPSNQILRCGPN